MALVVHDDSSNQDLARATSPSDAFLGVKPIRDASAGVYVERGEMRLDLAPNGPTRGFPGSVAA